MKDKDIEGEDAQKVRQENVGGISMWILKLPKINRDDGQ